MDAKAKALAAMDRALVDDPAWRFYRTFATPNQRRIIESRSRFLHIEKPNQVGGTMTMLVDAALYLKGIHPTRPRPKEPIQVLFIVPKKAQMGSIFGRRLFQASQIKVDAPAFAHLVEKEPGLRELGKIPLLCKDADAHLEKTQSSMGRVISKATVPGPYGNDELYFYISGDEKAWESIEGNNYHAIWRDEAMGKSENLMPSLRTRVMVYHDDYGTPYCGTIRWGCLASQATEELREFIKLCKGGAAGHEQIVLGPEDNPAISEKTRLEAAVGMSESEAKKRLWGTASAFDENRIWRVDRELVLRKEPYRLHPDDNLWLAYDPGWRDPCGLALFAIPRNTRDIVVLAFRSWTMGTQQEHVSALADMLDGRLAISCICDPAIKKTNSVNGTSAFSAFCEQIRTAGIRLTNDPCLGRNRYEDTVPLVQTYLSHQDGRSLTFTPEGDGIEEALTQVEGFRYKEGATRTLLEANVYQKRNTFCDLTRYLCSRFPGWVDVGSHLSPSQRKASAEIEAEIDPGLARHRAWLEQSAADCDAFDGEVGATSLGLTIARIPLN